MVKLIGIFTSIILSTKKKIQDGTEKKRSVTGLKNKCDNIGRRIIVDALQASKQYVRIFVDRWLQVTPETAIQNAVHYKDGFLDGAYWMKKEHEGCDVIIGKYHLNFKFNKENGKETVLVTTKDGKAFTTSPDDLDRMIDELLFERFQIEKAK